MLIISTGLLASSSGSGRQWLEKESVKNHGYTCRFFAKPSEFKCGNFVKETVYYDGSANTIYEVFFNNKSNSEYSNFNAANEVLTKLSSCTWNRPWYERLVYYLSRKINNK